MQRIVPPRAACRTACHPREQAAQRTCRAEVEHDGTESASAYPGMVACPVDQGGVADKEGLSSLEQYCCAFTPMWLLCKQVHCMAHQLHPKGQYPQAGISKAARQMVRLPRPVQKHVVDELSFEDPGCKHTSADTPFSFHGFISLCMPS
jgi:hypothetical protein